MLRHNKPDLSTFLTYTVIDFFLNHSNFLDAIINY